MPEIPELEAMAAVLNRKAAGRTVVEAEVRIPYVVRRPSKEEFEASLRGERFERAERKGKYELLRFASGRILAVHLMLTGRLQWAQAGDKLRARTGWVLRLDDGSEIRYFDYKVDGRAYLLAGPQELAVLPRWDKMGPDALDPALTFEVFRQRIRRYPGQIKRTLTNEAFIAGIGNAYGDEVLFEAKVYPFAATKSLSEEQLRAVYEAIRKVYAWAVPIVAERMGNEIDEKIRDFLKVHRKGGQPCPVCGSPITEVTPNQRITSWCRKCQGGAFG
ncbi:MAG: Fpg/Nei family DNA glycosylase [Chloroflexi bacterium]|nr:Fpg/Nei family DNA glycosylase [Chloroflexota bacterium]